jgi:flap endonuclease-1
MGVQISDIIPRREISISELKGKTIAIDAFNTLYQFLTSIRQPDGTPLMNTRGEVTSHLSGLFYRTINLLEEGIKPVYVFDGKPPELKMAELQKRKEAKALAEVNFEKAKEEGDKVSMRKYSSQTVRINDKIIEDSKRLLIAMGLPVIQAPAEGEAEAASMARIGKVWAAASQDYDSLLYGTPILVRNLTLARRRKTTAGIYIEVNPEIIEFQDVLNKLQIDKDQLICLAILVGTDYNPGGIKGLGQKRALEIVQKLKYPVAIFESIKNDKRYEITFDWQEVFRQFHEYEVGNKEEPVFNSIDKEAIKKILLENDFSIDRIDSGLEKLENTLDKRKQKGLSDFF